MPFGYLISMLELNQLIHVSAVFIFLFRFFTRKYYYLEFAVNPISTNQYVTTAVSISNLYAEFLKQLGVTVLIISNYSDLISCHSKIANERCDLIHVKIIRPFLMYRFTNITKLCGLLIRA